MTKTREDIVIEILEKLISSHGVIPNMDVDSQASIQEATESIFQIFGKTSEVEDDRS